MASVITPAELQAAQAFHGNICLGMPLGLRAGVEALRTLDVPRSSDKELTAIVEIAPEQFAHCFVDGIQWITGCTLGKNNLQLEPLGKFAVTLIEKRSQRAVRLSFHPEFLEEFVQWPPVAAKAQGIQGYRPAPGEVPTAIQQMLERPAEELFRVQQFMTYPVSAPVMEWAQVRCTECDELVLRQYAHSVDNDMWCPACWVHHVHAAIRE